MSQNMNDYNNAEFKGTLSFKDKSLTGFIAYVGTLGLSGGGTDPFSATRNSSLTASVATPAPEASPGPAPGPRTPNLR